MRFRSDFFEESRPIAGLKWVLDHCTVKIVTTEQREFIDSKTGTALMDRLFRAKDEKTYREVAKIIEDKLEDLSHIATLAL